MGTCTRMQFVDIATDIWKNHGIYLWSGNGEYTEKLTIGDIRMKESSKSEAARVLKHISDCYANDYNMTKSQAVDCSGLAIAILRQLKCIKSTDDYRARDLQAMCKAVNLTDLQEGDCVFNKKSGATHMGIYVGYDTVIEAKGRDYGVVKRKLSQGSWIVGGTLPYIK